MNDAGILAVERQGIPMKIRITALALALFLTVFMLYAAYSVKSERALAREMIRLRVIGASDGEEDQRIKLLVRDMLLEKLSNSGITQRDEALTALVSREDEIETAVEELLRGVGADYGAKAQVGNVLYPTCTYENFTLPAGSYVALTVTLGEGRGRNWWCVLFPPLCYGAFPEKDAVESNAVLWEDESNVEIRFRFRILEWIEKIKSHRD